MAHQISKPTAALVVTANFWFADCQAYLGNEKLGSTLIGVFFIVLESASLSKHRSEQSVLLLEMQYSAFKSFACPKISFT